MMKRPNKTAVENIEFCYQCKININDNIYFVC